VSRRWRLVVTPQAERDLNRLPEKAVAAILEALVAIQDDPTRLGKPLRGELEGVLSARRGPYRILYRLARSSGAIHVIAIGHRADVYRRR
jgi:mRNA-degrading endonuclease RelE of RelBE toxin-antitoxin system